jgi:hypothetical protein
LVFGEASPFGTYEAWSISEAGFHVLNYSTVTTYFIELSLFVRSGASARGNNARTEEALGLGFIEFFLRGGLFGPDPTYLINDQYYEKRYPPDGSDFTNIADQHRRFRIPLPPGVADGGFVRPSSTFFGLRGQGVADGVSRATVPEPAAAVEVIGGLAALMIAGVAQRFRNSGVTLRCTASSAQPIPAQLVPTTAPQSSTVLQIDV